MDARVSLCTDDVAVWAQDRVRERALQKAAEAIGRIARWSTEEKLQISKSKCNISIFSQDPKEARWRPEVEAGVASEFWVLSFCPHAERVTACAGARSRALAGQSWSWRRKSLVSVFLVFMRSVLDYYGAGWQPWLAPSSLDVLTRAQNQALRMVTGQCPTPVEAGVPQYPMVARRWCIGGYKKVCVYVCVRFAYTTT